ncbi:MAG TPA: hypothetical protein VFB29_02835 [Pseudolabrys sp.]|nr:hypothetical protein [Pseudolabrys sp.]
MPETRPRLSKELCLEKASECRALAMTATQRQHRVMLEHIASTWDRIAETYGE